MTGPRLGLSLVVGIALVCAVQSPVSAHASLVRSDPADASTVATAPVSVTLTFDENVRMPSVIVVTDAHGNHVNQGGTSAVDNVASTQVAISMDGDYAVSYRVVSADGHPVSGRLGFTVGEGGGGVGPAAPNESPGGPPSRVIGMLAALALLGGLGLLTVRRWAPDLFGRS